MGKQQKTNPDNPFAGLDTSAFPKERGQAKNKVNAKNNAPKMPSDQDATLFLEAMKPVNKLGGDCRQISGMPAKSLTSLGEKLASKTRSAGTMKQPTVELKAAQNQTVSNQISDDQITSGQKPMSEADDFSTAMRNVKPLNKKGREVPPEITPVMLTPPPVENPLQDIVDGKVEFALRETEEYVEGHVVGLDIQTIEQLQIRHFSPEANIDLHGLNSEQAYANLIDFFRGAYYKGVRVALVVTGRGKNSLNGVPVLLQKIQRWLVQEPFRRVVLAFCTAKREDGGPGALYIMLRKYRKNSGKVRWDIMPVDPDLYS